MRVFNLLKLSKKRKSMINRREPGLWSEQRPEVQTETAKLLTAAISNHREGNYALAGTLYQQALAMNPQDPYIHNNLGNSYQQQGQFDRALMCYQQAIELAPNYVDAHFNLGNALSQLGRWHGAIRCYDCVIKIDPEHGDAHYNKALELLAHGEFNQGWQEYEWRFRKSQPIQCALRDLPLWQGQDISNRSIIVVSEQSIGDVFFYMGFITKMLAKAQSCTIQCDARLVDLLSRSFPQVHFINAKQKQEFPVADVQVPLASLPRYLGNGDSTFLTPYLQVNKRRVKTIKKQLAEISDKSKVGIAWSSHHPEKRTKVSIPIDAWQSVLAHDAFDVVNLQYGDVNHDLELAHRNGGAIHTLSGIDLTRDIDGLAALISALDKVICIDSSVATLAAALGKETYLLLNDKAHFIWQAQGEISVWYPSVRLLRRGASDHWQDMLAYLVDELMGGDGL